MIGSSDNYNDTCYCLNVKSGLLTRILKFIWYPAVVWLLSGEIDVD